MAAGVGWLFPGQGSQSVGMGRAFFESYPVVRELYEEATAILGYDVAALCFEGPAERLNLTEYTQPLLLTASLAALRVFETTEATADAVAGHSLGEYSAIVAAGGLSFNAALSIVQKRGRYMAQAVPPGSGLVAALLGMPVEAVRDVCREASSLGVVAPANYNCPGQIVIAGEKAATEQAIALARGKGCRKAIPLPVSVPVHTPLMKSAADRLAVDLAEIRWSDLQRPLINNVDATVLRSAKEVQGSLIRQLPSPVQWEDSIRRMRELGISIFIEIGPGTVLSGLVRRILPDAVILNVEDPKSLDNTISTLSLHRSA